MPRIASQVDLHAAEFKDNVRAMEGLVEQLRAEVGRASQGGSRAAHDKHRKAGKLPARERVRVLLDTGSPFLEFSQLAAHGMYGGDIAAAGIVTGIGRVAGRECVVVANDPTVKGGTYYPMTVKKHLRAQEIARDNRLPCIYLVESGGAFLPAQDEVFPDRDNFGRIFYNQATLSAAGIAQISVVHGSCTAGGAYVPAMSDENVIVRNQGRVFLGGPPLVKAATGEDIDAESLGGADVHCRESGVCDHYAENDTHALAIARGIVARLKSPGTGAARCTPAAPHYDAREQVPLLFLQNITGFMVGRKYESGGIAKDGAKLVTAVSTTSVPKLTVIIGGSFGAGNYGMCGRAFSPRFLFMWPNARISVMGGEQASVVMSEVGQPEVGAELRARYEHEGRPWYSTARLWDDGVIDPRRTRDVLAAALAACASEMPVPDVAYGVFRM